MHISLEINDDLIDGFTIGRMAQAFHSGRYDVFLCHRIGSIKDNFDRPMWKFLSGKGVAATPEEAYAIAFGELCSNVAKQLEEQNAREPSVVVGFSIEEVELFKFLDT